METIEKINTLIEEGTIIKVKSRRIDCVIGPVDYCLEEVYTLTDYGKQKYSTMDNALGAETVIIGESEVMI